MFGAPATNARELMFQSWLTTVIPLFVGPNTMSAVPLLAGWTLPAQLRSSLQAVVEPPPSHVKVAACADATEMSANSAALSPTVREMRFIGGLTFRKPAPPASISLLDERAMKYEVSRIILMGGRQNDSAFITQGEREEARRPYHGDCSDRDCICRRMTSSIAPATETTSIPGSGTAALAVVLPAAAATDSPKWARQRS